MRVFRLVILLSITTIRISKLIYIKITIVLLTKVLKIIT